MIRFAARLRHERKRRADELERIVEARTCAPGARLCSPVATRLTFTVDTATMWWTVRQTLVEGLWQAAILKAEQKRPKLRVVRSD
jgi:hypothetical protein